MELYTIDNEAGNVDEAHDHHKPYDVVSPLCYEVCQRNEQDGCRCGEDELQTQFPYSVDEIAVAHTIDEDEDVCGH